MIGIATEPYATNIFDHRKSLLVGPVLHLRQLLLMAAYARSLLCVLLGAGASADLKLLASAPPEWPQSE